jgi:hypothetical protein
MFIVRVSDKDGRLTRKRLPGDYADAQTALKALGAVLTGYVTHGRNEERGYWWARDHEGNEFRFEIK